MTTPISNQSLRTICRCLSVLVLAGLLASCASPGHPAAAAHSLRIQPLLGTFGTYDGEPRRNGHVDVVQLVAELDALKVDSYNYLIHRGTNDWEDLKLFLPLAREHHIKVWVTLLPPSESPPRTKTYSEPFRLDYQRWGVELATLSLREPALVAWSLDDFSYNVKWFTPEYLKQMSDAVHAINPRFAFVPCLYYRHLNPALVAKYRPIVDGVLFPYRHEMNKANLKDWDTLPAEVAAFRQAFGPTIPVILDVYASKHATLGRSTPEYVRQLMTIGRGCADGVMIYCHPNPVEDPEKYQIIQSLFTQWSATKPRL